MIRYQTNTKISAACFIDLLKRSTLAARRPIDDLPCIEGMLEHSNLLVSAWHDDTLVGIARSMTDFHYACYLSDLAVDASYQKQGIGRQLMSTTMAQLGPRAKLILISAPAALAYYPKQGFSQNERCFEISAAEAPGKGLTI